MNDNYSQADYDEFKRDMDLAKRIKADFPDWYADMASDIDKEKRMYKRALPKQAYDQILSK